MTDCKRNKKDQRKLDRLHVTIIKTTLHLDRLHVANIKTTLHLDRLHVTNIKTTLHIEKNKTHLQDYTTSFKLRRNE